MQLPAYIQGLMPNQAANQGIHQTLHFRMSMRYQRPAMQKQTRHNTSQPVHRQLLKTEMTMTLLVQLILRQLFLGG